MKRLHWVIRTSLPLWLAFGFGTPLTFTGCMPTGGGTGKPPESAICAWVQFPGERLYVCASAAELKLLEEQAATARSKAGLQ